jgi:predicted RNA-binding protein Jag
MSEALHRPQAEALLNDLFRLMDYPARLDFKDMPDGALGVAVHFEGDLPGVQAGKRSYLLDCIQFLVNKAVNRPNQPRRWINLGVNAFPEPKGARAPEAAPAAPVPAPAIGPAPAPAVATAPAAGGVAVSAAAVPPPRREPRQARPPAPPRAPAVEAAAPVSEDPTWTRLGQELGQTSTRLGRVYAVMLLSTENRARLQTAASAVPGVSVKVEGDGHWRRLVVTPHKLTPLPKKHVMPDWDDDEAAP